MNGCNSIQARFSEYLDGRLTGHEMQHIAGHLETCGECAREWSELKRMQTSLAHLGRVHEPEDLLLRIRVAVSQERARSHRGAMQTLKLAWSNTIGPFMLQAAAGFASAVLLLGTVTVLVGMVTRPEVAQAHDEPLGMATAPRFMYLSGAANNSDDIANIASPVVVEAYINDMGEVYDYRIVSGPIDDATRSQVENLL